MNYLLSWFTTTELTDQQLKTTLYPPPWNTHKSIEFQRGTNTPFYNHSLASVLASGNETALRKALAHMGIGKNSWTITEHTGYGGRREKDVPLVDWIFAERMRGCSAEIADFLVEIGADVNKFRHCGYPLHVAAEHGNAEMVEFLVRNGANVNVERAEDLRTALHLTQNTRIVEILVENGAFTGKADIVGMIPLAWHARNKHRDVVQALLKCGATVNTTRAFCIPPLVAVLACFTIRDGFSDGIVVDLIKYGADLNPGIKACPDWLRYACLNPSENNFYILSALVAHGVPLDNEDWANSEIKETALHVAIMCKFYDAVWRLVLAGASTLKERKEVINLETRKQGVIELCSGDRKMLEAIHQVWSQENHSKFPKCVREAIKCTLLVLKRLEVHLPNKHEIFGYIAFDWHDKIF